MLTNKNILLIISGGIAAYKALELIRGLRKLNATVRCILTNGGSQFVTPMSVAALSEHEVYTDLFSLKDESEMGHIQLSRDADLIVVAPASANMMAKMAHGLADDLASTCLLASSTPIMVAPAMNQVMGANPATQANIKLLSERGVLQVGPDDGAMACGETGLGRMVEPDDILSSITDFFLEKPLKGLKAVITSGPTYEPIDPVRFIGNRSSGKQGHAIAESLIRAGAEVHYVSGPTKLDTPIGVTESTYIESAKDMLKIVSDSMPADIFISAAAVCDWTVDTQAVQKIKKDDNGNAPQLTLSENPDILKIISAHKNRPQLVIGFAAETENLKEHAKAKLKRKKCDWLVGNNVSASQNIFGSDENQVCLLRYTDDRDTIIDQDWPRMSKKSVANKLVDEIVDYFENMKDTHHEFTTTSIRSEAAE